MNRKKTIFISVSILVAGIIVTAIIFLTEPTAKREGATKETAMLVEVEVVNRGNFTPEIVATGTVQPAEEIMLSPRVGGEIIRRAPAFTPGGYVRKGEVLLQIDPSDYRNTLQLRESDLQQALADLNLERGRQEVAKQDYTLLGDTTNIQNKSLVLREPQLKSVEARVEAARAAVNQAKLNLQRTTIVAPFNAHILSRNANLGSQVAPGENLGRLVGYDEYWIEVSVPVSKVRWMNFPENDNDKGAPVKVRNRTAWSEDEFRTGYLLKLIGALEDQTRLARVLVSVPDPLLYKNPDNNLPRLIIGAFVETSIQANELTNVIRLNRDYLRKNETVWVMQDSTLQIRELDIILLDSKYAYVKEGLEDGDKVVATNLSTVVEGSPLRTADSESKTENDSADENSGNH